MPETWTVAGVQMDCALADKPANLAAISRKLHEAADRGARLVVFPECVLTGYGFESRAHALASAEPLPGPATDALARECARRGVWAVFGLLARYLAGVGEDAAPRIAHQHRLVERDRAVHQRIEVLGLAGPLERDDAAAEDQVRPR